LKSIHINNEVLEHFIPVSRPELIEDLCHFLDLSEEKKQLYQLFCNRFTAIYHAQLLQKNQLIDYYLPFSPDLDTISRKTYTIDQYDSLKKALFSNTDEMLIKANFKQLTQQQLNKALNNISPYGVEVSVNFDAFDEIKIFYRGVAIRSDYKRLWKTFWLKKTKLDIKIFRRLFILLQPKNIKHEIEVLQKQKKISYSQAENLIKKKLNLTEETLNGHTIYIKFFKDIPQSDLEMLFPNTRVRMRLFDKIKLSITGGSGTIGGIAATAGKIAASIDPITIAVAIFGFAGVLWRQISSIFTQRTKYMATLSQHLYYYNMDNNRGALTHIIDLAEAEETKEAILTYFFLQKYGDISSEDLDQHIELFILNKYAIQMDFEVSDGIAKLKELGLIDENNHKLSVIPLESALLRLKTIWDKLI